MTKANEKDETLFSHMALKPMTPEQLFDSLLTATSAHKAGGERRRRQASATHWLSQFLFAFANDEGEEGSSFQGTIPQALMMMNGELMEKAAGGKPGSFLADLASRATRQARTSPEAYMVNHLYLAALSRYPDRARARPCRASSSSIVPRHARRPRGPVLGPAQLQRVRPEPLIESTQARRWRRPSSPNRDRPPPTGLPGGFRPMSDRLIVPERDVPPPLPGPPGDHRPGPPGHAVLRRARGQRPAAPQDQQELHPALDVRAAPATWTPGT